MNPNPPVTPQTVTNRHALAYTGIILATVLLGSFGQQLAAGLVPIPKEWSWLTPVLLAGIVSLTTLLPRVTDSQQNSLAQVEQPAPTQLQQVQPAPIEHVVTVKVAPSTSEPRVSLSGDGSSGVGTGTNIVTVVPPEATPKPETPTP